MTVMNVNTPVKAIGTSLGLFRQFFFCLDLTEKGRAMVRLTAAFKCRVLNILIHTYIHGK